MTLAIRVGTLIFITTFFSQVSAVHANYTLVKNIAAEFPLPFLATSSTEFFTADLHNLNMQDPKYPENRQKEIATKICRHHGYEKLLSYRIEFQHGVIETLQFDSKESKLVKYIESSVQGWEVSSKGEKIPTSDFLMGRYKCGLYDCEAQRPWIPHAIFSQIECEGDQRVVDLRKQLNFLKPLDFSDHFEIFVSLFLSAIEWASSDPNRQPIDFVLCHLKEEIEDSHLNVNQKKFCNLIP
jgi:hypothetical protein